MTLNRLFSFGAVVVVIAGLALAFVVLGTPGHQRLVSFDERRASDLERTATALYDRYHLHGLPAQLPESQAASDPVTGRHYEFRRLNTTHYVLCADFATTGTTTGDEQRWTGFVWPLSNWLHGIGHTCYELDVTESPPMPRRV